MTGDIVLKIALTMIGFAAGWAVCAILTEGARADAYNDGWWHGYNEGTRLYSVGARAGLVPSPDGD